MILLVVLQGFSFLTRLLFAVFSRSVQAMSRNVLPSRWLQAPLANGIGRHICQLQRITIKFCKSSPDSRGVRYVFIVFLFKKFSCRDGKEVFHCATCKEMKMKGSMKDIQDCTKILDTRDVFKPGILLLCHDTLDAFSLSSSHLSPDLTLHRDYIESELVEFSRRNPETVVYVKPRRFRKPLLVAEYGENNFHFFAALHLLCSKTKCSDVLSSDNGVFIFYQSSIL